MFIIIVLIFVGLIGVGGYFGYKQLKKLLENMKILHHRQSQSVSLGDVDSVVETRVENAVAEAMSLERRRLDEMYTAAMEQAERLAKQAQKRPKKRKRPCPIDETKKDIEGTGEEHFDEGEVSSTYELPNSSSPAKGK